MEAKLLTLSNISKHFGLVSAFMNKTEVNFI